MHEENTHLIIRDILRGSAHFKSKTNRRKCFSGQNSFLIDSNSLDWLSPFDMIPEVWAQQNFTAIYYYMRFWVIHLLDEKVFSTGNLQMAHDMYNTEAVASQWILGKQKKQKIISFRLSWVRSVAEIANNMSRRNAFARCKEMHPNAKCFFHSIYFIYGICAGLFSCRPNQDC